MNLCHKKVFYLKKWATAIKVTSDTITELSPNFGFKLLLDETNLNTTTEQQQTGEVKRLSVG